MRRSAHGEPRLSTSGSPTDRGFTGQRELAQAGFADFNARWFDTSLGGFASPDSLIPDPFSPQSLNRYGYVLNNPLRYTDPTGHRACDDFDAGGRCVTAPPAVVGTTRYTTSTAGRTIATITSSTSGASTMATRRTTTTGQTTSSTTRRQTEQTGNQASAWTGGPTGGPGGDDASAILANAASSAAQLFDSAAVYVSTIEAAVVDVVGGLTVASGCILGSLPGPEGVPIGCGAAASVAWSIDFGITQLSVLGRAENFLGALSFSATAASDWFGGNTGYSEGAVTIGRDTLVSLRNAMAGLIPEANIDMLVSLSQYNYDRERLAGIEGGGFIELRSPEDALEVVSQLLWENWR